MKTLKQIFNELLPVALDCGIKITDFWDMTYVEIVQTIESFNRQQKNKLKIDASMVYQQSQLIGCFVGSLFSKDAKIPTLYESFPNLFDEEMERERQLEREKANILLFVEKHNATRKRGGN